MSPEEVISQMEQLIRRDPAQRGLIGVDGSGPGTGELAAAAAEIAGNATGVCLVTGFFIPGKGSSHDGLPSAGASAQGNAETDGPPATAMLAAVLMELGISVRIVTDSNCAEVVREAAAATGLSADVVQEAPLASHDWRIEFGRSSFGREMTHVIPIERVGPAHTLESIRDNDPHSSENGQFESSVDASHRGCCFNMRGESIDRFTGDLHLLIDEMQAERPDLRFIAVGDGGNEIGMGRYRWSELRERINGSAAARIPCRIGADQTIVAGTSNWGAYALAAAVSVLREEKSALRRHTVSAQQRVLERIVREGGAVDGVTRRREPTVDGLPGTTYFQPWSGIRRLVGLQE